MLNNSGTLFYPVVQAPGKTGACFFNCLIIGLLGALSACANAPPADFTVNSLIEYRRANVVIQEWDISCGAAALATILTYQHNDAVSEKDIAEAMLQKTDPLKVRFKGGFSLLDMKRFVVSRGYSGVGYRRLSLENLIDLGPAIVPVDLDNYNHFVVFRGMRGDKVLLADPAFGNRTVSVETFERTWLQNISFVVSRGDDQTPPNRLRVQPVDFINVPPAVVRHSIHR